ncbi:MAG: Ig-like domain-containing protein [Anaerovoracaceae bacterium]
MNVIFTKNISSKKILMLILTLILAFGLSTGISKAATAKSIKITTPSKSSYSMVMGMPVTFKVKVSPKSSKKYVKWSSSNKSVATVSSKGKVTPKAKGTAIIYAK